MPTFKPQSNTCPPPKDENPCGLPDPVVTTCWNVGDLLCPPSEGQVFGLSNIGGATTYTEIVIPELSADDVAALLCEDADALAVIAAKIDTDDQTAGEVPITDAGEYFDSDNTEGALQELGECKADHETRLATLEAVNPVVDTEVIAGSSDVLVTYLDGTTETLDLPEFSGVTGPDGLITFDLNGTPFGPFDTGAHAVDTDTDTFSTIVDNQDGTVTVTYADGSVHTYDTGPHTVDTDTVVTYSFVWAADGSVSITGSDGSTFTGPPNTVDTDTDTFSTLAGQTITFANGDTLTVADTDVTAARIDYDEATCDFKIEVDEGGSTISSNTVKVQTVLRDECGNKMPVNQNIQRDTAESFTEVEVIQAIDFEVSNGNGNDQTLTLVCKEITNEEECRRMEAMFHLIVEFNSVIPEGMKLKTRIRFSNNGGASWQAPDNFIYHNNGNGVLENQTSEHVIKRLSTLAPGETREFCLEVNFSVDQGVGTITGVVDSAQLWAYLNVR